MNIYDDATKITKEAMDNSLKSIAAVTKGMQQLAAETQDYTKRSYEQQASMFEKLMQARSLDTSIQIQNDYAKSAYQDWVSQATKVSEICADTAKEVYKPYEATMKMTAEKSAEAAKEAVAKSEEYAQEVAAKTDEFAQQTENYVEQQTQ